MAGQQLSPRQKMINMMYLVLLAILALNVSSEALDAFITFRDRLSVSALDANQTNLDYLGQLQKAIQDEIDIEHKTTNAGLIDTLELVRSRTQTLIAALSAHARQMEEIAEFDPETGAFNRFDELEENYRYWMGADEEENERRGNGAARSLRDSLDAYFAFLNSVHNGILPDSLHLPTRKTEDPVPGKEDAGKRWEQYTFQGPVVANLGVLESIKLEVYQEEKRLLDKVESRFTGQIFAPDKVVAISSPTARIVPAGMEFQTKLFVGMASSQMKPQFQSSSGRIALEEGGNMATLSVSADGSRIPNGAKEYLQTYTATIRVPKLDGSFEELQIRENFVVRKPEVVLTSTSVQNLYQRCANTVNIDVPALGDAYNPVISASNATVRPSERSNTRFLIEPSGRESMIRVQSRTNGQLIEIDRLKYNVISPPKPEIEVKLNSREYNGSVSLTRGSQVTVRLKPDAEFQRLMGEDARYGVERIVVKLKQGLPPASTVATIPVNRNISNGEFRVNLGSALAQAGPGDKVFLELQGLYRINYRGERIPDPRFGERERTVSFVMGR